MTRAAKKPASPRLATREQPRLFRRTDDALAWTWLSLPGSIEAVMALNVYRVPVRAEWPSKSTCVPHCVMLHSTLRNERGGVTSAFSKDDQGSRAWPVRFAGPAVAAGVGCARFKFSHSHLHAFF